MLYFRQSTTQPKSLEILGGKLNRGKFPCKTSPKVRVYVSRLSSFAEILSGKYCSIRHWLPIIVIGYLGEVLSVEYDSWKRGFWFDLNVFSRTRVEYFNIHTDVSITGFLLFKKKVVRFKEKPVSKTDIALIALLFVRYRCFVRNLK